MAKETVYITKSSSQTQALGKGLAKSLYEGTVLAFFGNLGSGKTTFIQGLAQGLGIKRRIISPTFIILRQYKLKNGNFYHVDLYRTESYKDAEGVGLDQIIHERRNIVAIEWAEKIRDFLPKKRTEIHINAIGEDKREIKILNYG